MSGGLRPRGYNLPVSSIDKVPPRAKGRHVSPLFRRDWGRKGSEIWDGYRTRSTCRSSQIFLQRKSFSSLCLGTDEDRDSPRRMTVTFPQELTSMRSRYRIRSIRFTLLAAPAFLESPRCRAPIQPQERDSPRPPGLQLCEGLPVLLPESRLGCLRQATLPRSPHTFGNFQEDTGEVHNYLSLTVPNSADPGRYGWRYPDGGLNETGRSV